MAEFWFTRLLKFAERSVEREKKVTDFVSYDTSL